MNLNRLYWKHAALSLLLSLATLISACGGDTTEPAAEDTLYYVHTDHLDTPQVITDADQKTGLHYNYFRDYDPALGRYVI